MKTNKNKYIFTILLFCVILLGISIYKSSDYSLEKKESYKDDVKILKFWYFDILILI